MVKMVSFMLYVFYHKYFLKIGRVRKRDREGRSGRIWTKRREKEANSWSFKVKAMILQH